MDKEVWAKAIMCASPILKENMAKSNNFTKGLDLSNLFNDKKVQEASIHHIQLQTVVVVVEAEVGEVVNSISSNSITYENNNIVGSWEFTMGAKCSLHQTSSHAPHNRLPPQPLAHLTTMLVLVVHPHPMNSRPP